MRAHSEILMRHYVLEILFHLRSQTSAAAATAFVTEYALVTFRDIPPFGDYLVRSSKFTAEPAMLHNWAKTIPYRGATTTGRTHVAAGLCAALQLGQQHEAHQRCIVLITNNVPRALTCGICDEGGDALQHAHVAAKRRVCLSVVSSRRVEELVGIFNAADPNRLGALEGSSWILSPHAVQIDPQKALFESHYASLRALAIAQAAAAQRQAATINRTEPASSVTPPPNANATATPAVAAAAATTVPRAMVVYSGALHLQNMLPVPSPIDVTVSVRMKPEVVVRLAELFKQIDGLRVLEIWPNITPDTLMRVENASLHMLIEPRGDLARQQFEQLKAVLPVTSFAVLQSLAQRSLLLHVHDGRVGLLFAPQQTQQHAQPQQPQPIHAVH